MKGYEGLYEVSDGGKVRTLNYNHTGKVKELSPGNTGSGYLQVILYKEGKLKQFLVHRLVVEAFISEIPKGLVVNHKDENKQNNNVDNLEICTYKYNLNYGTRNERAGKKISTVLKGKTPWNKGKKGKPSPMKGKQLLPETRAKISERLKGVPWSQARRDAQNKKTISFFN